VVKPTKDSIFLLNSVSYDYQSEWGTLLKSNSNGTYYGVSLDHVHRHMSEEVDYSPIAGIDGVALANILSNPGEVIYTRKKETPYAYYP